jgi:acyl-coenzyme A thioesterase PaaI-like protein
MPEPTEVYPPPRHVLRDLALSVEPIGEGRATARTDLRPALLRDDGEPVPGVLATVVDAIGGLLAMYAVVPDWMATNELTLHRWGSPAGAIAYDGTVLRRGRTNLVIEVAASDERGTFAASTMSFSVLPRRPGTPEIDLSGPPRGTTIEPLGPTSDSLTESIGYRVDAGGASLDLEPYVRNSFGALNGGVLAGLVEPAAVGPAGGIARQLTVHYLRQATVGPVVARQRPLGETGGLSAHRVEVVDTGASDRQCAAATVLVDRTA